eukprot:6552878-Lingulodinium_polyedra.AAC.1
MLASYHNPRLPHLGIPGGKADNALQLATAKTWENATRRASRTQTSTPPDPANKWKKLSPSASPLT